jgi:hypothetical protein
MGNVSRPKCAQILSLNIFESITVASSLSEASKFQRPLPKVGRVHILEYTC